MDAAYTPFWHPNISEAITLFLGFLLFWCADLFLQFKKAIVIASLFKITQKTRAGATVFTCGIQRFIGKRAMYRLSLRSCWPTTAMIEKGVSTCLIHLKTACLLYLLPFWNANRIYKEDIINVSCLYRATIENICFKSTVSIETGSCLYIAAIENICFRSKVDIETGSYLYIATIRILVVDLRKILDKLSVCI